ncbi:MAG TPA: hypothetical protein VNT53_08425 [Pseudolysinimonas sp.]|nr:hypothetical protein [Pseudolysinimonas sp.]
MEERPSRLPVVIVAVLFALLYGYALWQAIANLIALPQVYEQFGIGAAVPWAVLIAGVLLPPVLFASAVLVGRGRPPVIRALVFAAGLGATNALALGLVSLVGVLQPAFG